ncbi:MAG: hypothetical protein ACYC6G_19910 [Desulfobaccales bacterium]
MGIENLPKAKWGVSGRQPEIKGDMIDVEEAILQSFGLQRTPTLTWVDGTSIKASATPYDVAAVMMSGFPSVLHPNRFVTGGLTDERFRKNTADVAADFDLSTDLWGTPKTDQCYVVYAIAANAETGFRLKFMPIMRVKSQAGQVISLGTSITPANGIGYGPGTDEWVDAKPYFLTGASAGLTRPVIANNNDNGTAGTITYGGDAVTLAQGDWFVILPNTNFRFVGDVFKKSSGGMIKFTQQGNIIDLGEDINWTSSGSSGNTERVSYFSPIADMLTVQAEISGEQTIGSPFGGTGYYRMPTGKYSLTFGVKACLVYEYGYSGTGLYRVMNYRLKGI